MYAACFWAWNEQAAFVRCEWHAASEPGDLVSAAWGFKLMVAANFEHKPQVWYTKGLPITIHTPWLLM